MIYWILLFLCECVLAHIYQKVKTKSRKAVMGSVNKTKKSGTVKSESLVLFLMVAILVYFAGFRDGLGVDYTAYQFYCETPSSLSSLWFLDEPIMKALYDFCFRTRFSAVIFFLLTSLAIYGIIVHVYSLDENFLLLFFFFLFCLDYFMTSLTLPRQFVVSAIFLLGGQYLLKEKRWTFFFLMIVSFLIHRSSIVLLPVLFIKKDDYHPGIIALLIVFSIVLPISRLLSFGVVGSIFELLDYSVYMDYDVDSVNKFSTYNMLMHLLFLPLLLNKKRIMHLPNKEKYIFSIKMMATYLICNNISANNIPIFYRMSFYFIPFVPIALSALTKLFDARIARFVILLPVLFLLCFQLINFSNNRLYVPNKILPLNSIVDQNYHPYQNPASNIFN